jgi:hypothetical protein
MPQTIDNMTATWNSGGTTFTGIRFNVTDTASAAGSLLMDLQVGGVSRFTVEKNGSARIATGGILYLAGGTNFQISYNAGVNGILFSSGGLSASVLTNTYFEIRDNLYLGWAAGFGSADLRLFRDAADTLAQRRGVNAQTSRIYGTFTDASNYRRLVTTMSTGGVAEIKPEGAGTGASGNVLHISGLPTANPGPGILWDDGGTVKVGT